MSLLAYSHVFFSSFDGILELHSFPTRRSSDLGEPSDRCAARPAADPACTGAPGVRTASRRCPRPLCGRRDRKSTRLNSSHVAISYAVFCLKKKRNYKSTQIDRGDMAHKDTCHD